MEALYFCNRTRCGDRCSYPVCKHTTDEKYALNPPEKRFFDLRLPPNGRPYILEIERGKQNGNGENL